MGPLAPVRALKGLIRAVKGLIRPLRAFKSVIRALRTIRTTSLRTKISREPPKHWRILYRGLKAQLRPVP